MGSTILDSGNLAAYGAQLADIGCAMTATGDILLYGCNVAQGDAGLQFITSLAQATQADVAASTDVTGSASLGGDWVMERVSGEIEVNTLAGAAWSGLLAMTGIGLITANTTWGAGEVINLTDLVQIAPGVTLTIEAGAIVNGNNQTIQTFGTLKAAGSASNKIEFNDTRFLFGGDTTTPGRIEISHALINDGSFLPATSNSSHGSFSVTDSSFTSVEGFYIWYPSSASDFERNVFFQSDGLSIGTSGVQIFVTNNVFVKQNGSAIENWASYGGINLIVEHNSFLSTDRVALNLPDGYNSAAMRAENNYFGTTDSANISARVYDRTDSLNVTSVIDYDPILTKAHADTPIFELDYAPTPLQDTVNKTTILFANTTWGAGEVINLTGLVQIAPGVTLTIEAGAIVNGNNQTIQTFGTLKAAGSASNKIEFNDTRFLFGGDTTTPGRIEISHALINDGSFLPATGNSSHGSFSVTDSSFTSVEGFYIWYPSSASDFERNVFFQSDGLSIGTSGVQIFVTNNVFVKQNGSAIENWASYGGINLIVEHNSFLSTDRVALNLPDGYNSAAMRAENNYFGTTDSANISARVYDRTDSLNVASVIDYDPILTKAHADTPIFEMPNDPLNPANQSFTGTAANESFTGGTGNDTIDGGAGIDTAIYSGKLANYSVTKSGSSYSVKDKTGSDGSDTLSNIESLKFADKTVNLTIQAKAAAAPQADVTRLIELYVAFFNRVPDADGLSYWIDQLKGGQSMAGIADSFYAAGVAKPDLTGFSASMTDADFVKVIYKNVLGRSGSTAPPDTDVAYWVGNLASGANTRGTLIDSMLGAAHGYKGDATWGWVPNLLDNKITVAKTFAIDWGLNYLTADQNITQGIAIAAAVTATDTAAAIALIGVTAGELQLL